MEEEMGRISVADQRTLRLLDLGEELKDMKAVTPGAHTDDGSFLKPEPKEWQFLPGLPNDITFHHIVPKLHWTAFTNLWAVSGRWQKAIESRQVFNARVRSHSAEVFVVIHCLLGDSMRLYCVRDKSLHGLPQIPHLEMMPHFSGIIAVDGKIYVLGGWEESSDDDDDDRILGSTNVHVFDPAGEWKWKKCANMLKLKYQFVCSVADGKRYVFDGVGDRYPDKRPEVYDPKLNAWSWIASMPSSPKVNTWSRTGAMPSDHCPYKVLTLGEEMFLLSECHEDNIDLPPRNRPPLLAYHTVEDEWRVVQPFSQHDFGNIFVARGKFHLMTTSCIDVLSDQKHTWKNVHSHSMETWAHADADNGETCGGNCSCE